jgi:hypothetical protein
MPDPIERAVIEAVYGGGQEWLNYVECGPDHADKNYPARIFKNYSNQFDTHKAPHIVPDNVYHPEIKVAIDFTHQFVLNTDEEELKGKRPVSPDVLRRNVERLARFFVYYFDYVLTYEKKDAKYDLYNLKNLEDEKNALLFLNDAVNWLLTGISVERTRTGIGSATITLRDNPNYRKNRKTNIFLDKTLDILNQLFVPMLPVTIWARGRLYKDYYFPIFDGYLMRMSPGNAQGFTTITLSCLDTLELARTSAEMINPAIIQMKEFKKQTAVNIFAKPLYGIDHKDIFNMMFHGGAAVVDPSSGKGILLDAEDVALRRMWNEAHKSEYINFTALGNFLRTDEYTTYTPNMVADHRAIHKENFDTNEMVNRVSHRDRRRRTVFWGASVTPYRVFNFQSPQIYTSEFSSRLEIMRDVAGIVYQEFYVDGYGDVQYHPMRLGNDFLQWDQIYVDRHGGTVLHEPTFPGAQVIGPQETMNVSSSLNVEEMVTFLRLYGVHPTVQAQSELLQLVGSAIDKVYMARYGYRRKEIRNVLFNYNKLLPKARKNNESFLDVAALALLRFMNGELNSRTATTIFRPEIELASPVFFTDDNSVFYVQSISHSVNIGGDATTTINANFGRKDYQTPPDLFNFIVNSERLYKTSGKELFTTDIRDDPEREEITAEDMSQAPIEDWSATPFFEQEELDDQRMVADRPWEEEDETWGVPQEELDQRAKEEAQQKKQIEMIRRSLTVKGIN